MHSLSYETLSFFGSKLIDPSPAQDRVERRTAACHSQATTRTAKPAIDTRLPTRTKGAGRYKPTDDGRPKQAAPRIDAVDPVDGCRRSVDRQLPARVINVGQDDEPWRFEGDLELRPVADWDRLTLTVSDGPGDRPDRERRISASRSGSPRRRRADRKRAGRRGSRAGRPRKGSLELCRLVVRGRTRDGTRPRGPAWTTQERGYAARLRITLKSRAPTHSLAASAPVSTLEPVWFGINLAALKEK